MSITRALTGLVGVIAMLAGIVWGVNLRFTNPDMTETRMFLEFWPQQFGIAILVILGVFIFAWVLAD